MSEAFVISLPATRSTALPVWQIEPSELRALEPYSVGVARILDASGISLSDLRSRNRATRLVEVRIEVCGYLRARGWSFGKIGRWFGHCDHTSALNLFDMYLTGRRPWNGCRGAA